MGNMSEVDEAQCICLLAHSVDKPGSVTKICQRTSPKQNVLSACHATPHVHCLLVVLSVGNYTSEIEFYGTSPTIAVVKKAWKCTRGCC